MIKPEDNVNPTAMEENSDADVGTEDETTSMAKETDEDYFKRLDDKTIEIRATKKKLAEKKERIRYLEERLKNQDRQPHEITPYVMPTKKRKYELQVEEIAGLSKSSKRLLCDRIREKSREHQMFMLKEIDNAISLSLLCPCKFKNNRQCKGTKRPISVDPDQFCASCRNYITKNNWINKKPATVLKSPISLDIEDSEEDD
jgi:hypothetical protein